MRKWNRRELDAGGIALLALVAVCIAAVWWRTQRMDRISFTEHLEDTAVTIDGVEHTFKDLAFYVAQQEMKTQKQAKAYDLTDPEKYWNLHVNGVFIRVKARELAMEQAVHDAVFYQMALETDVSLSQEEITFMENQKKDFWSDLEEEGQERLGVSEEDIDQAFKRIALAQKQQQILTEQKEAGSEAYSVGGERYQDLLEEEHTYEVNQNLWKRLNFGNITVN